MIPHQRARIAADGGTAACWDLNHAGHEQIAFALVISMVSAGAAGWIPRGKSSAVAHSERTCSDDVRGCAGHASRSFLGSVTIITIIKASVRLFGDEQATSSYALAIECGARRARDAGRREGVDQYTPCPLGRGRTIACGDGVFFFSFIFAEFRSSWPTRSAWSAPTTRRAVHRGCDRPSLLDSRWMRVPASETNNDFVVTNASRGVRSGGDGGNQSDGFFPAGRLRSVPETYAVLVGLTPRRNDMGDRSRGRVDRHGARTNTFTARVALRRATVSRWIQTWIPQSVVVAVPTTRAPITEVPRSGDVAGNRHRRGVGGRARSARPSDRTTDHDSTARTMPASS